MPITARVMFQRVFFGLLAIVVLVFLFQQDAWIAGSAVQNPGRIASLLQRGSVIPLLFFAVFVAASSEMTRMLRANGLKPHGALATWMIMAIVLTPWLSAGGFLGSTLRDEEGLYWPLALMMFTVLGATTLTVFRGDPAGAIRDTGATVFMVFYLGFLGSFGLQIRCSSDVPLQEGVWLLLITILVTKCSDIGAFFTGTAIGRHKLAPSISPGKSIEGFFGGLCASALAGAGFAGIGGLLAELGGPGWLRTATEVTTRTFSTRFESGGLSPVLRGVIFGLIMSALGQLGDLFESCLKRDAGVKDSGNFIPKYGGILDLIDSPLMTMPAAWFLFTVVWNLM